MKKSPNAPRSAFATRKWLMEQRQATSRIPGQNRIAYEAHADIFRAIEARDAYEAELQMRTHLAQVAGLYARVTGGGTWVPM
jgi:DNA-binding FadR family transcriptional regulator